MTRFDEVARILESAAAVEDAGHGKYMETWPLEVARCFQRGDDRKLDMCVEVLEASGIRDEFVDAVRRAQKAAAIMEEME